VWLDHRGMAAPATASAHAGHDASTAAKKDGVAMAQLSKLYTAVLDDTSSVEAITGGVCYCCKTAVATGPDGATYAAWRHVYAGNLRDIAFTLSRDGGRTFAPPQRVSEDRWQLDGCPDDGPAMGIDSRERVHVVWPTIVTGESGMPSGPAIFYAASSRGGPFGARQRVPTEGVPHHPQLAVAPSGAFVVAWDELQDGRRRVVVASGEGSVDGAVRFRREVLTEELPGTFPVVQYAPAGPLVAWTSGPADTSVIRIVPVK